MAAAATEVARAGDASLSRAGGPLRRDGRWLRTLPFGLIGAVTIVLTLLPSGEADAESEHVGAVVAGGILFAVMVLAVIALPWDRWSAGWQYAIPVAGIAVVILLRHAQGSGDAGYVVLFLLPVLWVALYGTAWQLGVTLPIVAAAMLLPPVVDEWILGEGHYPAGDNLLVVIVLLMILFTATTLRVATNAASRDALTGLPNRRVFEAALRRRIGRRAGRRDSLSVALIDLDHFKRFNDRHGHVAGDRLLETTASAWRALVREEDLLARVGGEEFALVVSGDARRCSTVVERLLAAVPDGQTASAGVAERRDGEDPLVTLDRADQALYAAKDAGRARLVLAAG